MHQSCTLKSQVKGLNPGNTHLLDALPSGGVPNFAQLGVVARQQDAPQRVEGDGADGAVMPPLCSRAAQRRQLAGPANFRVSLIT